MRSSLSLHPTRGFTLIEILIAMAIGAIVMAAIVDTFVTQRKAYDLQEQIAEMTQNARLSMDTLNREIRMAGYNPAGATFDAVVYDLSQLEIRADLNGDGDAGDSDETIIYLHDSATRQLLREANGAQQPLAENIVAFTFTYLDQTGAAVDNSADVYQLQIGITARTANFDPHYPNNDGYRTYTLTSFITPRNLKYGNL